MQKRSVAQLLLDETFDFDFYKAVQLLEQLAPDAIPVGEGNEPLKEPVKFHAKVKTGFSASSLESLIPSSSPSERPELHTHFMSLAGANAPLPLVYAELIIERAFRGDKAIQHFFDIFNHRLISLLYRSSRINRLGYDSAVAPNQTHFAHLLFALFGMETNGLQHRMQVPDSALLMYTGLFIHESRSFAALKHLLEDYFQIPVEIVSFQGKWQYLPTDEWTKLGLNGQCQKLGQTATIGQKIWDQQSEFLIKLGALDLKTFMDFLPIGKALQRLNDLTRFFVGLELDFKVQLILDKKCIPDCVVQQNQPMYLGWNSWLKSKPAQQHGQITLNITREMQNV